ncbi:uncharacterized protein LOC123012086 [Tribolium madens]|uniref:uncharacterized protein LOC123012086 n=1 Tax=Tribolium madens TaxID=41895 RepID=UPI001CF720E2|nr:uncharacterized protein LOC123012086 [Tribolium madens]
MLRNVIICIATLMYIFGSETTKAASILRPSKNFLEEVADFDNIIEPVNIQPGNNLETRESGDEEYYDEDCPNGKCPRDADTSTAKSVLNKLGSSFLHKFFARSTNDADKEEKDQEKAQRIDPKNDEEFMQNQQDYENMTNATKQLYDQLEESQVTLGKENICCEEEEPTTVAFVQMPKKSGIRASNDFLEMHFYKQLPDTDSIKLVPHEQPVLINLFPKHEKNRRMESAKKYDYIALVPQGNRLIQVPAVKFTVLPEFKRRKKDIYSPYFSKLKRIYPFRHGSNYRHNSHSFSFIDNRINDNEPRSNKLYKRYTNLDDSNNKYLEEADFLIHNRRISLKSSLDTSNKQASEENSNFNQNLVATEKAKSEVSSAERGQGLVNTLEEGQGLVDSEKGQSLVDVVEGLSQSDSLIGSKEGGDIGLIKSEVGSIEEGQGLLKSELSGIEGRQGLVKSELSGMENGQGFDDSLVKSEIRNNEEFP